MENETNQGRLLELISVACDERLDERSRVELENILLQDKEARKVFACFLQMHCDLRYYVTSNNALQNALKIVADEPIENPEAGVELTVLSGRGALDKEQLAKNLPRLSQDVRPVRRWMIPLGLAASLLLVFGTAALWFKLTETSPLVAFRQPQQIANISGIGDAKWSDQTTPSLGDSLMRGQVLTLEEGVVYVSMGSGAELVLQSPCSVKLQSAVAVTLIKGSLTVQAADWAKGFQVGTDAMNIVDLGTKFCVSADDSGSVEVHVVKGQIRIEPLATKLAGRRSLLLSTGEGVQVDLQGDAPRRLKANYVGFVTKMPNFLPYKPIRIHNTGVGLAWGDEDSHWRITAGTSGGDFSGPQYAVVCRPDLQYLANVPDRSQWIAATENLRPGCTPNSAYTFETHFDLTGYDLSTVTISGQLLADNGVKSLRINGEPVPITPWVDNAPGQKFHRFRKVEIKHGLVPGRNKIEVDVWNGIYSRGKPQPNPMALRAEWEAYGRPISLDESI